MINLVSRALAATINTNLPGPYSATSSLGPVAIIGNIYYFALGIGGLLAFGSVIYAGIKWATSQGNPSAISDAKDQITQAALGLLLLLGSYIVLNTINPQLTILQIPTLQSVSSTPVSGASSTPSGGGTQAECGTPDPTLPGICNNGGDCEQNAFNNQYGCVSQGGD